MERRQFLKRFFAGAAGAAVAATLDVDKLLWVPGEKKIFIPPVTGWTSPIDTLKQWALEAHKAHEFRPPTFAEMTQAVAEELGKLLDRPKYAGMHYEPFDGRMVGSSFHVAEYAKPLSPVKWITSGSFEQTFETKKITFNHQFGVDLTVTSEHQATCPDWLARQAVPAAHALAHSIRTTKRQEPGGTLNAFGTLPMPRGLQDGATFTDHRTGVSVRGIKCWDPIRDVHVTRFDILTSIE